MRQRIVQLSLLCCVLLAGARASAQTFWTENFESGSTSGTLVTAYTGPNGTWSLTVTGTEGSDPNPWFVSCAENGHTNGVCGTGCAAVTATATGATLHVGSVFLGDLGASYDAGGTGFTAPQTDRRAESPVINCTSKFGITLTFNYIENGDGTTDDGTVWYYDGTTWSLLANPGKTTLCSGQGLWSNYSVSLPSSADNNPNVKIGFRWVNNDDGVGTDPSFAVDSVSLSTVASGVPVIVAGPASATVCVGTVVNMTSTVTGATTYQWQRSTTGIAGPFTDITAGMDGGVYGSSYNTATLTITTASLALNGYAYQLVATNGSGSATTTPALLNVTSTPTAGTISGLSNVCVAGTITLSDGVTGGTWSSSLPSVASVGSSNGVVSGATAGNAVITYTVVSSCGTASATFAVTVVTSPDAGTITGSSTICVGGTVTLSDGVTGGTWSSASTAVATVSGSGVASGMAAGADVISYTVSSSCGTATATFAVTVVTGTSAGVVSGPATVCVGASVSLTDAVTGGTWSCANANASISATGSLTGVTAGTDTAYYTITGGLCGNVSASSVVTVLPLPVPVIHTLPGHTLALGSTYASYQWLKNGTIITGATNATYVFTVTANYQVIVDSGSCSDTSSAHTFNLAVNSIGVAGNTYGIIQNGGSATLYADFMLTSDVSVRIFDMSGRVIGTSMWLAGTSSFRIEDSWYPVGVYIVRLSGDGTNTVLRWQKE